MDTTEMCNATYTNEQEAINAAQQVAKVDCCDVQVRRVGTIYTIGKKETAHTKGKVFTSGLTFVQVGSGWMGIV